MKEIKNGDIVSRKSYNNDIMFCVKKIIKIDRERKIAILKGIVDVRIVADAPVEDLKIVSKEEQIKREQDSEKRILNIIEKERNKKENRRKEVIHTGRILHLDGDKKYSQKSIMYYKKMGLNAIVRNIPEYKQPKVVYRLLTIYNPDIVVLTGHDGVLKDSKGMLDLNNYRNSKYFIESVKILRNYNSSYDELVIFAGACQSCYESILEAGANFASSPNRVLIHCLDPVLVCERVAYTRIDEIVSIKDVIENTITGIKGVGGLQTRGKYREGYPKSLYLN